MKLTLVPGNWLYNAGVIGFLRVMETLGEPVEDWMKDDGTVEVDKKIVAEYFQEIESALDGTILEGFPRYWWAYLCATLERKPPEPQNLCNPVPVESLPDLLISEVSGQKNQPKRIRKTKVNVFQGFHGQVFPVAEVEQSILHAYNEAVNAKRNLRVPLDLCKLLGEAKTMDYLLHRYFRQGMGALDGYYKNMINNARWKNLEKVISDFHRIEPDSSDFMGNSHVGTCDFCTRKTPVMTIDYMFSSDLFPAQGFPNSVWNHHIALEYCGWCRFFLIHRHMGLFFGQGARYFLNAPSFKLMWVLNRVMRAAFSRQGERTLRELFGTTLMESALRHQLVLHHWSMMNVEIVTLVTKGKETIVDFYALPADRVAVLTRPRVASLLKSIGDPRILQWVLDGKDDRLLEQAQAWIREYLKEEKPEDKQKKKKNFEKGQHLLELYTLIQEVKSSTGGLAYG